MRAGSKTQRCCHHGCVAIARHDGAQSVHESPEDSLLRIVIAVAHQHGAGVAHNFGCQK